MAIPPEAIGPATLAITQGIAAFKDFLPPITEIRSKSIAADPGFASDVRMGEAAAIGLLLGVGAITSYMTATHEPFLIALLIGSGLLIMYESILRSNPMTQQNGEA